VNMKARTECKTKEGRGGGGSSLPYIKCGPLKVWLLYCVGIRVYQATHLYFSLLLYFFHGFPLHSYLEAVSLCPSLSHSISPMLLIFLPLALSVFSSLIDR
jgi:hypothetical protein